MNNISKDSVEKKVIKLNFYSSLESKIVYWLLDYLSFSTCYTIPMVYETKLRDAFFSRN